MPPNRLEMILAANAAQLVAEVNRAVDATEQGAGKMQAALNFAGGGGGQQAAGMKELADQTDRAAESAGAAAQQVEAVGQAGQQAGAAAETMQAAADATQDVADASSAAAGQSKSLADVLAEERAKLQEEADALRRSREGLDDLGEGADEAAEQMQRLAQLEALQQVGEMLRGITDKIGQMGAATVEAAHDFDTIEDKLNAALDPAQVDEFMGAIQRLGAVDFSVDQFADATVVLKRFGVESEENLERVGNIARKTGNGLSETASIIAQLANGGDDASRAVGTLARQYNITGAELKEFGAVVDENNHLVVSSRDAADKAREALQRWADVNAAGAMERAATPVDTLKNKLHELSKNVGQSTFDFQNWAASGIIPAVDALNQLPPAAQGVIGLLGNFGSGAANVAGNVASFATQLGILRIAFPGVAAAIGGTLGTVAEFGLLIQGLGLMAAEAALAAAPFIAAVGLIAGAGVLANETIKKNVEAYQELDKATKDAADRQTTLARAHRENWAGKSAEELAKLGVSTKEMAAAQTALNDEIEAVNANEALSTEQKAKMVAALQNQKAELHAAALAVGVYEKAIKDLTPSLFEAQRAVQKSLFEFNTEQGSLSDVLRKQQAELEAFQREGRTQFSDDAAGQAQYEKALQQKEQAVFESQKRIREAEAEGARQILEQDVALTQARVENLRGVQRDHELAGQRRISDEQAVADAELAAAQRSKDAKLRTISDKQVAEASAGTLSAAQAAAYERQREAIEAEFTNAVQAHANRRLEIERRAMDEWVAIQRQRYTESLQGIDDQIQALDRQRQQGIDVEGAHRQAVTAKYSVLRAQEDLRHREAMRNAENERQKADENAKHAAAVGHLGAQQAQEEYQAQQTQRRYTADTIAIQHQAAQTRLDGISLEIQALENKRSHGVGVEQEMAAAIRAANEERLKAIELEKQQALATEQNPARRAAIEAKAQADTARVSQEAEIAQQRNHEAEMQRQSELHKMHQTTMQLQAEHADRELAVLTLRRAAGLATESDLQNAIKARFSLSTRMAEEQAAAERAIAEKIQDQATKAERLQQIELQLQNAREAGAIQTAQAMMSQDKSLQDLISKLEKMAQLEEKRGNSPLMSGDEAFGGGGLGLGNFTLGHFNSAKERLAQAQVEMQQKVKDELMRGGGAGVGAGAFSMGAPQGTGSQNTPPPPNQQTGPQSFNLDGNLKVTVELMGGSQGVSMNEHTTLGSLARDVAKARFYQTKHTGGI